MPHPHLAPQDLEEACQQEEGSVGGGDHSKVLLWLEGQEAVQGDETRCKSGFSRGASECMMAKEIIITQRTINDNAH